MEVPPRPVPVGSPPLGSGKGKSVQHGWVCLQQLGYQRALKRGVLVLYQTGPQQPDQGVTNSNAR